MSGGAQTLANILSQPEAWRSFALEWPRHEALLDESRLLRDAGRLIFTGCGSAYFAAQTLAAMAASKLGVASVAVTASDAALFPETAFTGGGHLTLVALSRSGQTSETVEAVMAFRRVSDGPVLALTSVPDSDLARAGDHLLDASVGDEPGIVQVRSISTLLLLGLAAIAHTAGEPVAEPLARLPDVAAQYLDAARPLAQKFGRDPAITRFFFLGAGPWRGTASESMLKVKEMSRAQSESFHTLEFRHGLGANANEQSLVVGLLSDRAADAERAVLDEFRTAQGATTLAIGASAAVSADARSYALAVAADLPEWARIPLALPFAQLLGWERARLNGLDPDEPENLKAFIALEGRLV
ncbi:MAG TPA: SIS domain-containing protein [Candidatus Limnocylindrales bacterium]|nr:SIS domain-containing protein [Candidatus Limnocylindrales bacterium]